MRKIAKLWHGIPWPRSREGWLLAAILLLALAVRAYGLAWGNPYDFHNDESFVVSESWHMLTRFQQSGSITPAYSNYGPWPFYFLLLANGLLHGVLHLLGNPVHVPTFFIGRMISVTFSVATVYLVWLMGRRLFGRGVGLLAAAILAVTLMVVRESHFYTVESQLLFFLVLAFLPAWQVVQRGRGRDYFWLSVAIGAALAVKISALPLLAVLWAAHFVAEPRLRGWKMWWQRLLNRRLWLASGGVLLFWFILNPFPWLHPASMLNMDQNSDLLVQLAVVKGAIRPWYTVTFNGTKPYLYPLRVIFPWGLGWPLFLTALAGWGYSLSRLWRGDKADWLLQAWMLSSFLSTGASFAKFSRYFLPLVPFMVLVAARFLVVLWQRRSTKAWRYAIIGLAGAVFLYSAAYTMAYDGIYSQPDTRLQALRWFKKHVPPGSSVTMEFDAMMKFGYHPERFGLTGYDIRVIDHYAPDGKAAPLHQIPAISPAEKAAYLHRILDHSDYVVIEEMWARRFWRYPHRFPAEAKFYRELFDGKLGYRRVANFRVTPHLGPWHLNDDNAEESFIIFDHPRVDIFRREP